MLPVLPCSVISALFQAEEAKKAAEEAERAKKAAELAALRKEAQEVGRPSGMDGRGWWFGREGKGQEMAAWCGFAAGLADWRL